RFCSRCCAKAKRPRCCSCRRNRKRPKKPRIKNESTTSANRRNESAREGHRKSRAGPSLCICGKDLRIAEVVLKGQSHSTFRLAALMIGHHLSASDFWKAAKAAESCSSRVATCCPSLLSLALTLSSAKAVTAAPLSLATISFGAFFGAHSPNQIEA